MNINTKSAEEKILLSGEAHRRQGHRGAGNFVLTFFKLTDQGILQWPDPSTFQDVEDFVQFDLKEACWYTDKVEDLEKLQDAYGFSFTSINGSDGTCRGIALESSKSGRALFLSFSTDEWHGKWKTAIQRFIPESASSASAKAVMLTPGASSLKPEELAFNMLKNCGPNRIAEHSPNNLYLDLCINNVELETRNNTFYLDMWVQMVWQDDSYEGKNIREAEVLDELTRNEPELEFLNQIRMEKVYDDAAHARSIVTDKNGNTFIQCVRRYLGTMKDIDVDIRNFPFDTQILEVAVQVFGHPVQSKNVKKVCKVIPCRIEDIRYTQIEILEMLKQGQPEYVSEIHGLERESWELIASNVKIIPIKYDFLGISYATMQVNFVIQRRWRFFFWKLYFVELVVVLLSCLAFGFSVEEYEQRINVVVALFLANVAFQFVTQESTPNVQYLTRLDKFLTVIYLVQLAIGLLSFIVNRMFINSGDPKEATELDEQARIIIPSVFSAYCLYYCISAAILRYFDRRFYWNSSEYIRMDPTTCEPLENNGATKEPRGPIYTTADKVMTILTRQVHSESRFKTRHSSSS
eukprot:m.24257 g.24257  ORF g.24257 m.24257 type:complete len:578 (-) comp7590_c0_seq4:104-1837(-)